MIVKMNKEKHIKLHKNAIDKIKARMEWKHLTGKIEVTIEVKTIEDLEKRLSQIAEQIISQNKDVYKTRYEKP